MYVCFYTFLSHSVIGAVLSANFVIGLYVYMAWNEPDDDPVDASSKPVNKRD